MAAPDQEIAIAARCFHLVDVFGDGPFAGNPLAVVHDADDLDTDTMQRVTRWMNLSETVFLLEPTSAAANYRARIFTLARELPFAGHPTLGAAHAWEAATGPGGERLVQECGAGDVPLCRIDGRLAFAAPPLVRSGPLKEDERAEMIAALDLDPEVVEDAAWVDNGPGWAALLLRSVDDVMAVTPPSTYPSQLDVGVVAFHPEGSDAAIEVRAFFSTGDGAMMEDPVTGSLNASVAEWLISSGRLQPPFVASQGGAVGRRGRVHLSRDDGGTVWVAGETTTVASGEITI